MVFNCAVVNSYEPMRVSGYLKTVLREGDKPVDDDDLEQRRVAILQMGEGHENVGEGQEDDCGHADMLPDWGRRLHP